MLIHSISCVVTALLLTAGLGNESSDPLRAGVVTGGHGFDERSFFAAFDSLEGTVYTPVKLEDNSEVFEDVTAFPYDVLVLYNMSKGISEARRQNFLALLDQGVGLVILHHAIANYPDWPAYSEEILGARYFLEDTELDGVTHARSEYSHDEDINVAVAKPGHPITEGLAPFTINDECYKGWIMYPGNEVLLTTDHRKSEEAIAWVRACRKARVCFIQLGHGKRAYENPSFRQLVDRAIQWTAGRTLTGTP